MPTYKLIYFNTRGLGDVSRQLFHLAGVPFEDFRYELGTFNAPEKALTPFGQLPVLEVDGKQIPQSFSIARYLGKEFGYAGKDAFEQAWVDAIGDQFKDYVNELRPYIVILFGFVEGDKEKVRKEAGEPARDKLYGILEKLLSKSSSGFLVGDHLTWIDLQIADHVDVIEHIVPGFFDGFPKVLAHRTKVQNLPKVKEWIEQRPKTKF